MEKTIQRWFLIATANSFSKRFSNKFFCQSLANKLDLLTFVQILFIENKSKTKEICST